MTLKVAGLPGKIILSYDFVKVDDSDHEDAAPVAHEFSFRDSPVRSESYSEEITVTSDVNLRTQEDSTHKESQYVFSAVQQRHA